MGSNRVLAMLLAVSAVCLAVTSAMFLEREMQADTYTFDPRAQPTAVYGMQVVVPKSSREAFFAAVKTFASVNGFKERMKLVMTDSDLTYIDLWRSDIAIGGGNFFEAPEFELAFYIDPNRGGSVQAATKLGEDLAGIVADVPGVSVSRTK